MFFFTLSEYEVVYWVVCLLIRRKARFEPKFWHQNKIQKVFLLGFPIGRFLAKTLRVNKIVIKVSQKICSLMYKINTQHKWCEKHKANIYF